MQQRTPSLYIYNIVLWTAINVKRIDPNIHFRQESSIQTPSTNGAETLLSAFLQPRNTKPMDGETESKKCCLNERSCGTSTIHSRNIFSL